MPLVHAWGIQCDVVYLLFIVAPIVCGSNVLGACLMVQYFLSFLALQSSGWGNFSLQETRSIHDSMNITKLNHFLKNQLLAHT